MSAWPFIVLLASVLIGSTIWMISLSAECQEKGGVLVKVVEFGDGLDCVERLSK